MAKCECGECLDCLALRLQSALDAFVDEQTGGVRPSLSPEQVERQRLRDKARANGYAWIDYVRKIPECWPVEE